MRIQNSHATSANITEAWTNNNHFWYSLQRNIDYYVRRIWDIQYTSMHYAYNQMDRNDDISINTLVIFDSSTLIDYMKIRRKKNISCEQMNK